MTNRLASVTLVILASLSSAGAQRSAAPNIQGVWRVVEQRINDRTLAGDKLGLGFHIYTGRHYAVVRESGTPPRPDTGDVDTATAAQLIAAWGPFVAQFGTYEIAGDRLTHHVLVAKNPENMRDRTPPTGSRFRLEGDTLVTEPYGPRVGRTIALKMVRVE